jgi:hypothetical protein
MSPVLTARSALPTVLPTGALGAAINVTVALKISSGLGAPFILQRLITAGHTTYHPPDGILPRCADRPIATGYLMSACALSVGCVFEENGVVVATAPGPIHLENAGAV